MKLPMENMEVAVKRKVSMLEIRDLTKKGAYLMSFFSSLRGGKGFTMDSVGLQIHVRKGKGGSPGSFGNTFDG